MNSRPFLRQHYTISKAVTELADRGVSCTVDDIFHYAAHNHVRIHVKLNENQITGNSVDILGSYEEPIARQVGVNCRITEPMPGINLYRYTLGCGEELNFFGLKYDARLAIRKSREAGVDYWREAEISVTGFWEILSWHFECWEDGGDGLFGSTMLVAHDKDNQQSSIRISGVALSCIQDMRELYIMGEELQRLHNWLTTGSVTEGTPIAEFTDQNKKYGKKPGVTRAHQENRDAVIKAASKTQSLRPDECTTIASWARAVMDLESQLKEIFEEKGKVFPTESVIKRRISEALNSGDLELSLTVR
jgi:hypothetical protein